MAVYSYLCPRCRNQFELMRPISEAEKPAECPKCASKAQKVISGFGSNTRDSIQSTGKPFSQAEVDSSNYLALSSNSTGDAEPLPVSGHFGGGASVGRRDMAQKSLLQMLEDLASKVRSLEHKNAEAVAKVEALEREKSEAVATARALEREVGELVSLITLAGEKVEEILKVGANDDVSQTQGVNVLAESKSRGQLTDFSPDPQKPQKRLFPHSSISD